MPSDDDIEYLDEDADIVQQCVQPVFVAPKQTLLNERLYNEEKLLVERTALDRKRRKRKERKEEEEDSDYDPNEDLITLSATVAAGRKKRGPQKKAQKVTFKSTVRGPVQTSRAMSVSTSSLVKKSEPYNELKARKSMKIRIPDFEDPLCLPVRALSNAKNDLIRLKNWNNMCLEHLKQTNTISKPEEGYTKKSTRTIILRNVIHKDTGKSEKAISSKLCIENEMGVEHSEMFQSILPKFREKKEPAPYNLQNVKKIRKFNHVNEVILTKEVYKEEEVLVAYKPKEFLCAVYKMDKEPSAQGAPYDEDKKRAMTEVALCKTCAPCYQTSWRGNKKEKTKNIKCPICMRSTGSVYNMLTHLKAHTDSDIRKYKRAISATFAGVVEYHYKCRICQLQCPSIKALRDHVKTHSGTELFKCEVCSRTVR